MIIIDAQVHVWPPDRPDRRLGDGVGDRKPYGYEQLIADMDRAGVDRAILVPPSFDADRNDYALEGARRYPDRFAVMGRIALKTSAGKDALKQWREQPGMLGVRLTFHRDADRPWLTDGTADWFWPEAQRNDIPVMVHAPERLTEIGAALLLDRAVSIRQSARATAPRHRGVRSAPRVLGQRYHPRPDDVLVSADGDAFHRGTRLPLSGRSRMDHGARLGGLSAMAVGSAAAGMIRRSLSAFRQAAG
jgi:hypothetical protein